VIGRELEELNYAESAYGAWVAYSFRGFMALSEAFLVFHLETPDLLNEHVLQKLAQDGSSASLDYATCIARHAIDYRALRAVRHLFFLGYPYQALTGC
jgi:hypothetical protein